MAENTDERRKSRRAFFTSEKHVSALLQTNHNGRNPIPVTLLSIGAGGISFTGSRHNIPEINVGDPLVLSQFASSQSLDSIDRLDAKVKYVMDNEGDICVVVGCEFYNISEVSQETIHRFVQECFSQMGFYLDD